MVNVATAVEAAEAVTQAAAPVAVSAGTLDPKKVAIGAAVVVGVGIGTYFCVRALKKRKANKTVIESIKTPITPLVDPSLDGPVE